ncbi:hypothetical protein HH214_10130 [Mucilaginibacter robiniae]|uniref:GH18 domain-containing protein n=1 Tax=Mucilaginibacter robiniae TaxID=2728022 RepID=A0A7L5E1D2_9SPHI|nr:glycosyl hydrolase family 18 protein [Mucilaginibacter robiniae]QJD96197.1 hypothetical protein HH214_10130 [Mucilaginibacter robiniae]
MIFIFKQFQILTLKIIVCGFAIVIFSLITPNLCAFAQKPIIDSLKNKITLPKAPKVPEIIGDSLQKTSVTLKGSVKALKADASLLKKMLQALKFKQNARAKEKQRIIFLIDSLVLNNRNLITSRNLEQLQQRLTDTSRQQYNELLAHIQALKLNPQIVQDTTGKEIEQQQSINSVIAKVLPMLKSIQNTQHINVKQLTKLQSIKALYSRSPQQMDTAKLNDSTLLVYKLRLRHVLNVMGYISYQSEKSGEDYNYNLLSSIALFTYEINTTTGFVRDLNNANTDSIYNHGVNSGRNTYLSFFTNTDPAKLLNNPIAQNNFFTTATKQLKLKRAAGLNIYLSALNGQSRLQLTGFIKRLYEYLRINYPGFQLSITVPGTGEATAYDLQALNAYANQFVIDFTKYNPLKPGPIAPIADFGNNNLQSAISRFINQGLQPAKIYLCLPYHGVRWTFTKPANKGQYPIYLPYKIIRSHYNTSFYNLDTSIAFSTETKGKNSVDTVWYDDENTLAKKYELALLNKIGGIALFDLGDGEGYSELWDVIAEKLLTIDTIKVKTISLKHHQTQLTFGQYVQLYYYFLEQPCSNTFSPELAAWLGVQHDCKKNEAIYRQMNLKMQYVLWITDIILGLLFMLSSIVLIYFIRREGEWWAWKKAFIWMISFFVILLVLAIFMSLYMDDNIPWFGGSNKDCVNMPFHNVLAIVIVSMVTGALITRFLIFPLLKREDIP